MQLWEEKNEHEISRMIIRKKYFLNSFHMCLPEGKELDQIISQDPVIPFSLVPESSSVRILGIKDINSLSHLGAVLSIIHAQQVLMVLSKCLIHSQAGTWVHRRTNLLRWLKPFRFILTNRVTICKSKKKKKRKLKEISTK